MGFAIRFRHWPDTIAWVFLVVVGLLFFCAASTLGERIGESQKAASELLENQEPPRVMQRVLQKAEPDNTSLYISLRKQRAWFFVDKEVAIDTPVSTGRRAAMTPHGQFGILEKFPEYSSPRYGEFVDSAGRVLRSGVSAKLDSAPSGTSFREVPKKYFLQLTREGLGLYAGTLPGYPASHTSVRFPEAVARLIFEHTQKGTSVTIAD